MINTTAALAATRVMDKPSAQEHQAALRCPRCDSTNTKFCYYNNYSLSQPRHFCKACKRYWTRGGTLRNVPVGGGCRKNKRIRKPTTTARVPSLPTSSSNTETSMRYSLPTLPNTIRVPSCTTASDLQLQVGALGAGLPSDQRNGNDYHLGQLLQQLPLMNDYPLFGSSLSSTATASLLVSSLQQPKKMEDNQALLAHEDLRDFGNFGAIKEVNIEGETNEINYCHTGWQLPTENSWETFGSAATKVDAPSDSSYLYWNGATGSAAAHFI